MDLDAADLLDVVHVLYEEDITPRFEEDVQVKSKIREQLYPLLYKRPYNFAVTSMATRQYGASDEDWSKMPAVDDVPVESRTTKPYVPPTNPDDFSTVLGTPLS